MAIPAVCVPRAEVPDAFEAMRAAVAKDALQDSPRNSARHDLERLCGMSAVNLARVARVGRETVASTEILIDECLPLEKRLWPCGCGWRARCRRALRMGLQRRRRRRDIPHLVDAWMT